MRKNLGFTLVEVLVAVTLTGVILLTGYSAFQKIMQAQASLGAAIDVQKNLFYTNEKLAALIRDGGTIDYEEYFNRRMLGYDRDIVDTNGNVADDIFLFTFTNFSHFGNGNVAMRPPIYYCGFDTPPLAEETCLGIDPGYVDIDKEDGTFETAFPSLHQPYGQYAALAYNYDDPVGYPMPIKLPPIFKTTGGEQVKIFDRSSGDSGLLEEEDPLNVGLPELYLIKKNLDNSYIRTYFRHVYVDDPFVSTPTCNPLGTTSEANINGCLGKIQMTKLEGCDSIGTEDGIIDAWIPACEFNISIPTPVCSDPSNYTTATCPTEAANIYKSALETDIVGVTPPEATKNLTWVDVTAPEMNVIRATFLPNPLKIPALMSGAGDPAQSPSVSVYLEVQLSTRLRNKSFVREEMNYPRTLITTYDLSE